MNWKILLKNGKIELLKKINNISTMANIYYVRQNHPLGLGHAILKAKSFIGDDPFIIALGDDIVYSDTIPVAKQLINIYEKYNSNIIGVQKVDNENISKYGVIKPSKNSIGTLLKLVILLKNLVLIKLLQI